MSDPEIDDAMSRATMKAWRAADSFDPDKGTLRAWFFVIARNAVHEILRDQKRRRWETRGDEVERLAADDEIPSSPPARFLATLRRCIEKLPRLQRAIIEADLKTGDVADANELAERLRTTKNSIYASRSIARKALKRFLLEQGYAPGAGRGQAQWN